MYLHSHLLPYDQQSLNDFTHLTVNLALLQIFHHLVADEKVHIVVIFILFGQIDKGEYCLQRRWLFPNFFDDKLDCLHQHLRVLATHTQTDQQLAARKQIDER